MQPEPIKMRLAGLEQDIEAAMEEERNTKPVTSMTPLEAATNKDTDRASRSMRVNAQRIIAGFEREIAEADEIRTTISQRITDLNRVIDTMKGALEGLTRIK